MKSHFEYDLLHTAGTGVALLERLCDSEGKGSGGRPVHWRTIATFHSYNDGERILRLLRPTPPSEPTQPEGE